MNMGFKVVRMTFKQLLCFNCKEHEPFYNHRVQTWAGISQDSHQDENRRAGIRTAGGKHTASLTLRLVCAARASVNQEQSSRS